MSQAFAGAVAASAVRLVSHSKARINPAQMQGIGVKWFSVTGSAKWWVGWAALAVGIGAVVASMASSSTRVGEGLTFGFGAFIAFFGLLSLLVRNRTPDHWGLFVVGLAMFVLPWLGGGFAPDRGAAWTAWVAGFFPPWTRENLPHGRSLDSIRMSHDGSRPRTYDA